MPCIGERHQTLLLSYSIINVRSTPCCLCIIAGKQAFFLCFALWLGGAGRDTTQLPRVCFVCLIEAIPTSFEVGIPYIRYVVGMMRCVLCPRQPWSTADFHFLWEGCTWSVCGMCVSASSTSTQHTPPPSSTKLLLLTLPLQSKTFIS